ncbi:AIR carboxylase [Novipirellula aureliae]|uniref:AIR carboxylase n=1 Tax=Novipirellula aureliae TaxID=2527966 RepID=A0A5C6E5C6_9BACT|nr:nickel pincer cofactor biosynthesis protein LarB [Novipirellula aureliae]TWU43895.1 AIR carboxylase [Novipirellula aureliae]
MPSQPPDAREIIAQVATGAISIDDALARLGIATAASTGLENLPKNRAEMQSIGGATVDLGRRERCGFSEVIYGEGKNVSLIADIIETQQRAGQSSLATRLAPSAAEWLQQKFPSGHYNSLARTFRTTAKNPQPPCPAEQKSFSATYHAAVVTAGSTDTPVAEEAIETLIWMEIPYQRFDDIGVAGPQRLLAAVPQLRQASAVVVIAGMEGALPAAIAGHLSAPIFAVPTSVGYGATLGGLTPLLGMLSSCASNVATVNIDAGFKGGYLAGIVVQQLLASHSPFGKIK